NAAGTVTIAGRWISSPSRLSGSRTKRLSSTAAVDRTPPTSNPAAAQSAVGPRHQMPSTSSGQNVEAATAKTSGTVSAKSSRCTVSAIAIGNTADATAANRKSFHRPRRTSVNSTPARLTTSPDDVDTNAAA